MQKERTNSIKKQGVKKTFTTYQHTKRTYKYRELSLFNIIEKNKPYIPFLSGPKNFYLCLEIGSCDELHSQDEKGIG